LKVTVLISWRDWENHGHYLSGYAVLARI